MISLDSQREFCVMILVIPPLFLFNAIADEMYLVFVTRQCLIISFVYYLYCNDAIHLSKQIRNAVFMS